MTEIAPGMMVECIDDIPNYCNKYADPPRLVLKAKYFVKSCNIHPYLNIPCICLSGMPNFGERWITPIGKRQFHFGFSIERFRPIGGDKEIEREQFQQLKSDLISEYRDKLMRQENDHVPR